MGSLHLLSPAKCGLNLTVRHPLAIADDEMIADPQPVLAIFVFSFQMLFVNTVNASTFGCGMVQDDVVPVSRFGIGLPRVCFCDRINWMRCRRTERLHRYRNYGGGSHWRRNRSCRWHDGRLVTSRTTPSTDNQPCPPHNSPGITLSKASFLISQRVQHAAIHAQSIG